MKDNPLGLKPLDGKRFTATIRSTVGKAGLLSDRALEPGERYVGQFIAPDFQRPLVWTAEQKVLLIESVWLRLPIGSIAYNAIVGEKSDGWLLDGQQRVTALTEYVYGEFAVRGFLFPDLELVHQRDFLSVNLPVIETSIKSRKVCMEIYDRLAYGGTPHEPKSAPSP